MTRKEQKQKELKASSFFLARFNTRGFDYEAIENLDENANKLVDVYARSKSKKHEDLKLQLTIIDGSLHQAFADIRAERKKLEILMQ